MLSLHYFKYRIKAHKKIIKNFVKGEDIDILDIGVGTGTLSKFLEKKGNCVHVDMLDEVIDFNSDLEIIKGFFPWGIDLPDKKYDYILLFNFLEYNDTPRWILEIAKSKLKPNGKIIITTQAGQDLTVNDKFYGIKRRYKMEEVQKMMNDLGLKEVYGSYFEGHSLQVQVKDALNKMFDEATVYWNKIPQNNDEIYNYLLDKDLYYLCKQKLTQGNQIVFVAEIMTEKEKEKLSIKRQNDNKKVSLIDRAIEMYAKSKENKQQ